MLFANRGAVVQLVLILAATLTAPIAASGETAPALDGKMVVNGDEVTLGYVYVYAQQEGFYDPADPTWTLLFVEHPIEERNLDDSIWDSAYLRLGITETAEFDDDGDEPKIQVFSQDIRFSGDTAGNVSGGSYPEIELTVAGPDSFAGRVYQAEMQEFFDDTYQYDFTFSAPMSDPFGPIGDPLPKGGGQPGEDYLAYSAAVLAGDLERLKNFMRPEQLEMLEDPAIQASIEEDLEFMKMMTPTDIAIVGGSSDGETAILNVTGTMEGAAVKGEITLEKVGDTWLATNESWQ